ncbi:hypothetical protein [Georgenia thermotolerans]|uniref:Uncharacterized protein n=1 Tax=Georgenia thermotolerans TaxID=527326 RepID=A0A7J5UP15_9MICO|nr:hypothetical protein [Georgenia thermotolerans]KAE8764142.1 hypothetical protein GB883_10525 [Georgenia thermotolerans]
MTTPPQEALPTPSPADLDGAAVVTVQDFVLSILLWTGVLVALAGLVVAGGWWLVRRHRSTQDA